MYSPTEPIERHPDLMALRAASESAATKPIAQGLECLSLLAGLFLAVSPWIVGFQAVSPALTINNLITGLALVVLALGFGPAFERTHAMSMAAFLIGVWTIIAPYVIYQSPRTTRLEVSNIVTGAVICLFALMTMGMGMASERMRRLPPEGTRR